MKSLFLPVLLALACLSGCRKPADQVTSDPNKPATTGGFTNYFIKAGSHYCEGNVFRPLDVTSMSFTVRFDSTAVYTTKEAANQEDINKLWGFADNNEQHHTYSARIGWRWSGGALRLFAYVYNQGQRQTKEIATIAIGMPVFCRIAVAGNRYLFTVNETQVEMPRQAVTLRGKGYQLYPYFGGDEAAPHPINIWIKEG